MALQRQRRMLSFSTRYIVEIALNDECSAPPVAPPSNSPAAFRYQSNLELRILAPQPATTRFRAVIPAQRQKRAVAEAMRHRAALSDRCCWTHTTCAKVKARYPPTDSFPRLRDSHATSAGQVGSRTSCRAISDGLMQPGTDHFHHCRAHGTTLVPCAARPDLPSLGSTQTHPRIRPFPKGDTAMPSKGRARIPCSMCKTTVVVPCRPCSKARAVFSPTAGARVVLPCRTPRNVLLP